jgi:alkylation response protein AidB-like acyl-CoA dehydrogenase
MDPHEELRAAVRRLVARHSGDADGLWARLCGEIGVAGRAVPECYGGAGAGLPETQVVLAELGRTLTPAPLLGSAVLCGQALLAAGDASSCERLLPGIAAGTRLAALVWTSPAGRWRPDEVACRVQADGTLAGTAHHVLDGDRADVLLVATGAGLFEVDPDQPGVSRSAATTMDVTRRLAVVRLAGATGRRVGPGNATGVLARVRDVACAALSAEQVGAAARALELTVEYTKLRRQFDRPIGAFQALQHRMADLHVLVETARSAAEAAGAADGVELPVRAAVAKVHCSEALMRVAGEMIQLHGGIGITWEHDAHRYFKRAHSAWHLFGQPAEHVARIAPLVLGVGPDGPVPGGPAAAPAGAPPRPDVGLCTGGTGVGNPGR